MVVWEDFILMKALMSGIRKWIIIRKRLHGRLLFLPIFSPLPPWSCTSLLHNPNSVTSCFYNVLILLILELLDYKANTVRRCTYAREMISVPFVQALCLAICLWGPQANTFGYWPGFLFSDGPLASEEVVCVWDHRGNQPAIGAQHWMESSTGKENYKHSPCCQRARSLMEKANMLTQEKQALGLHCAFNHVRYLEDAHKPWSLNIGNWSLWFGVK